MTKGLLIILLMLLVTSCAKQTSYRSEYQEEVYFDERIPDRNYQNNFESLSDFRSLGVDDISSKNCLVIGADGATSYMNQPHNSNMPSNHYNPATVGASAW
ncbi:MAG: hypothetical protein ACC657_00405 [Thiohalomonadales bacterium]